MQSLSSALPSGEVVTQEGWVESVTVPNTSVFIKGKYDLLVKNPDGTHMLVDLKISEPGEDKIEKYKTQLSAYKFALENPKEGEAYKITRIGLLIFYPDKVVFENGTALLDFPPKWLEVPADEEGFLAFAKEVDKLLKGPEPKPSETCKWCIYRSRFSPQKEIQEDLPF